MASPALVARVAGWTPEEAARYQVALLRGLAADRQAQRLYLRKVQIIEMMRTKTTAGKQEGTLLEANTKNLDKAAVVAGGRCFQLVCAADRRRREVSCEAPEVGGPASEERREAAAQKVAESLRGSGGEGVWAAARRTFWHA